MINTVSAITKSSDNSSTTQVAKAIYLRPLRWKVGIISVIALLFSTNVVSSFSAESSGEDFAGVYEEDTLNSRPVAMAQDGFLVKPSLQTAEGQRNGINDIITYTVKAGDTVSYLAARFNIATQTILWANNLDTRANLKVGQQLLILPVDGLLYKVQKDDSLEKIAKKYNVTTQVVLAQNNLKDQSLSTGQQIILPGAQRVTLPPATIAQAKTVSGSKNTARFASLNFDPSDPDRKEDPASSDTDNQGFSGQLAWPVAGGGRVTQRFSYRHPALDITYGSDNLHPSILAADGGVVVEAYNDGGWHGGYGNVVVIDHGGGVKTRYAHNMEVYVSVGSTVRRGQVIAKMGNTGRVYGKTGIHSHFEVIVKGKRVNPYLYY